MMPLLIALLVSLTAPDVDARRIAGLSDPSFRVRERAERQLRQETRTWVQVLKLEVIAVSCADLEARRRLGRIVERWWGEQVNLDWRTAPHIDALNRRGNCDGACDTAVSQAYFARAMAESPSSCPGVSWPQYRLATWLLVQDLVRCRLPPCLIRGLIGLMQERTMAWERRQDAYERMPTPPREITPHGSSTH
jgi:hypothetical protein